MNKSFLTLCVALGFVGNQAFAQDDYNEIAGQNANAITTAVPFMMISPDSYSGAMGDAGVAIAPNAYSQNWNSSKYAFIEEQMGFSISYTPWLQDLVDDMNLAYLSGFYRLDKLQTIGVGFRYFSMGNINFTDIDGNSLGSFSPHELAFDLSYNRKLGDHFSLGIAGRFIYSNLTGGQSASSEVLSAGKSGAMDINGFYTNKMKLAGYKGSWAAGFNVSNIGAKLSYSEEVKNFIPTNLRLGGSMTLDIDQYNSITGTLDINKLLVPTPPIYYAKDETKPDGTVSDGSKEPENIKAGMDNNVGIVQGMVQSFYDAPRGFEEEMEEISYAMGLEYWYAKQFAIRAGYFHEHENKGNRKYVTAGVGLKMSVFGLDFSYLIPTTGGNSPLNNTWRFSLIFNFDDFANQ